MKSDNIKVVDIILLPGLHGTDTLFSDFKERLHDASKNSGIEFQPRCINYPIHDLQSYLTGSTKS